MNCTLMHFFERLLCFNAHFVVLSALRTPQQNIDAGGASNSQHLSGEAIDIKPYGTTTYDQLLDYINSFSDNVHVFDQLILYPSFIHISFGTRNRHQLIDKRK